MHLPLSCSFTHHFFNYFNVSDANPRFWASSPTYRILPPCCCHPLALNYNQVSIKNVINRHAFTIFQFVHSQCFQLNQCIRCELKILGIFYHRPNLARLLLPPACVQCKYKCEDPSNIYSSFTHQIFN